MSDEELPVLLKGNVKVEWVNLGEGNSGDFDEGDPEDVNLLRFDFSRRENENEEWDESPDGSYCTLIPASTPREILEQGLQLLMESAGPEIAEHGKAKRTLEQLSWITPQMIEEANVVVGRNGTKLQIN